MVDYSVKREPDCFLSTIIVVFLFLHFICLQQLTLIFFNSILVHQSKSPVMTTKYFVDSTIALKNITWPQCAKVTMWSKWHEILQQQPKTTTVMHNTWCCSTDLTLLLLKVWLLPSGGARSRTRLSVRCGSYCDFRLCEVLQWWWLTLTMKGQWGICFDNVK